MSDDDEVTTTTTTTTATPAQIRSDAREKLRQNLPRDDKGRVSRTLKGHRIEYTTRNKPQFKLVRDDGKPPLYYCNEHREYLAAANFYPASVRPEKQERMCAQHCSARSAKYQRRMKTEWSAAFKYLQDKERKVFGNDTLNITVEGIRRLIEDVWQWEDIRFVSYNDDDTKTTSPLRVVRWDPEEPCMPWNLVCMCSRDVLRHVKMVVVEGMRLDEVYDDIDLKTVANRSEVARDQFYQEDLEEDGVDFVESDSDDPDDHTEATLHTRIVRTYRRSKLDRMTTAASSSRQVCEERTLETFTVRDAGPPITLPWSLRPLTTTLGGKTFDQNFSEVEDEDDSVITGKKRKTPASTDGAKRSRHGRR